MPYVWAVGLVYLGLHDETFWIFAWCGLFVFGTWVKPMLVFAVREAIALTEFLAGLTAEPPKSFKATELAVTLLVYNQIQSRHENVR